MKRKREFRFFFLVSVSQENQPNNFQCLIYDSCYNDFSLLLCFQFYPTKGINVNAKKREGNTFTRKKTKRKEKKNQHSMRIMLVSVRKYIQSVILRLLLLHIFTVLELKYDSWSAHLTLRQNE